MIWTGSTAAITVAQDSQGRTLHTDMANKIKGNGGGPNGGNESYTIPGRGTVARPRLVREVEQGKHPNFGTVTVGGKRYVRGNPDPSKGNNVNED